MTPRFSFRRFAKADAEWEFDPYIAKILTEPAADDDAVVARVKKVGATDEEAMLAVLANRALAAIVAAWDGEVPADVVKAIDGKLAKSTEAQRSVENFAPTTPIADDSIPPWFGQEIERQREKDPGLANVSDDEIMRRLIVAHPEWGNDRGVAHREQPQSLDQILRKTAEARRQLVKTSHEVQRSYDRRAGTLLEDAAQRVRRREPNLTAAQAFTKALQEDPDLYAAYQRDQLRKSGHLNDSGRDIEAVEAIEDKLSEVAARVLKDSPGLTRAQAIAKAYKADPTLYE